MTGSSGRYGLVGGSAWDDAVAWSPDQDGGLGGYAYWLTGGYADLLGGFGL